MRKFKVTVIVALILAVCVSMTACGLSKEDVVGTWSAGYTYEGSSYGAAFVLNIEGTYTEAVYKANIKEIQSNKRWANGIFYRTFLRADHKNSS